MKRKKRIETKSKKKKSFKMMKYESHSKNSFNLEKK